jgi:hypothetical protein
MKFGRKSKNSSTTGRTVRAARGAASGPAPRAEVRPSQRNVDYDVGQGNGGNGLPGRAGYANGPRTALPVFFEMRRPDGKPAHMPVKKRFFG